MSRSCDHCQSLQSDLRHLWERRLGNDDEQLWLVEMENCSVQFSGRMYDKRIKAFIMKKKNVIFKRETEVEKMRLVVISPQRPASLEIKQHRKSNSWWWHQCFCVWTLIEIKSVSSKSDCDSWAASVTVHNLDKKKPCGPRQVRKQFYLLCNKWVW